MIMVHKTVWQTVVLCLANSCIMFGKQLYYAHTILSSLEY